ncbi:MULTISPECIES: HrcA family transcriptional regulator [unclassified Campylobacter]|uniref:HrcA family transcriptional regulator n=1 Tax=unclassified Campylobacter TaxID=2593542 RepID=UPI003D327FAF
MSKLSKRDLILNSIIKAYLDENAPIGSSELGSRMDVSMPASTIRVYFKKLSDEGAITQLHISGGRIPTVNAMRHYWANVFGDIDFNQELLDINDEMILKILSDKYEVYTMIYAQFEQNLIEILNVKNRFLVLNFTKDEIVLKYDTRVEKFLQNIGEVSLDKLELICSQVGLSELRSKIRELKRAKILFQENEIFAYKMFEDERFKMILEPSFATHMSDGLNFDPIFESQYLGLKLRVKFSGETSTMICAGSVYNDYIKLLKQIREAA